MVSSLENIEHIFYINLDSRADRLVHMQTELAKMGYLDKATRFSAISMPNLGAIGCSLSHLKCLQLAKDNNWSHVLILEDDVVFTNPKLLSNQAHTFFASSLGKSWDVLLLGGNAHSPYQLVDNVPCVKVNRCFTTTAYLVNGSYLDTLIQNVKESVTQLINKKHMKTVYAIDVYWMKLQNIDKWYLLTPLTVTQKADYSNIENVYTDYSKVMLKLH